MRAAVLLAAALEARGARVLEAREWPWASATFTGDRHRLRLAIGVGDVAAFLDGIEEAEFDLGRFLLADLAIEGCEAAEGEAIVTLEALTIEDRRAPVEPRAPTFAGARPGVTQGQAEPPAWTSCGTKAGHVPLAAA